MSPACPEIIRSSTCLGTCLEATPFWMLFLLALYLQLGQTPDWKSHFFWVYSWFFDEENGQGSGQMVRRFFVSIFASPFFFLNNRHNIATYITGTVRQLHNQIKGVICHIVQIHSTTTLRPYPSSIVYTVQFLICPVSFARSIAAIDGEGSTGEDAICDLFFFEIWVWGGEKQHLRVGNVAMGSCHCLWFEGTEGLGFRSRWMKWRRESFREFWDEGLRGRWRKHQPERMSNLYKLTNRGHTCSWCLYLLSLVR